MVFFVTWIMFSSLTYGINAGDQHGRQLDPYQLSDLPAPSDSYGFPAENLVAPSVDYEESENNYGIRSPELDQTSSEGENLTPPETFYRIPSHGPSSPSFDHPVNHQGHIFPSTLDGSFGSAVESSNYFSQGFRFENGISINSNFQSENPNFPNRNSIKSNLQGHTRFVGNTFRVGKPLASSSRVVYKNVVTKVPVEVTRHIEVDVPQPEPVPVRQEIQIPVPEAYPAISEEVVRKVPYTMYKTQSYEVERPYELVRDVPYPVIKRVKVELDKPFTMWKNVRVPVKKRVDVPVPVWKPYPVELIKHVTHYKMENCCW